MLFRFAAALVLLAASLGRVAAESEPPEYFQVAPLPKDDPLTVRAEPSGDAESLGALPGGTGPIEVVATRMIGQTEWAQILWDDRPGWVAKRFLEASAPELLGKTALPVGLVCTGTEPFWGLTLESQTAARWFSPMTGEPAPRAIAWTIGASARIGWPAAVRIATPEGAEAGVMIVRPGLCSDGMSDRDYGWLAAYQTWEDGQPALYEGCCRLPRPD